MPNVNETGPPPHTVMPPKPGGPKVGDLRIAYDRLVHRRREFLDYAHDAATLTLPALRPRADREIRRPWTQLGTQAVRSLAASVLRILMPPNAKWLRFDFSDEIRDQFEAQGTLVDEAGQEVDPKLMLDGMLADMEDEVIRHVETVGVRARLASALRRNLVEGTTGCAVFKDHMFFIPLRDLVVFREAGRILYWLFRNEYNEQEYSNPPPRTTAEMRHIYTYVDYQTGEVWQQRDDGQPVQTDAHVDQFFVMTGTEPDIFQYPTSYVWEHLGIINEINHLSERLGEATSIAAWNLLLISPGADINQNELTTKPSGSTFEADKEDFHWLSAGLKIGDWSFVTQYRNQLREELANLFAMGIKDRAAKTSTATEILQIAGELETHTHDLLSTYETTFQRNYVKAVMRILGFTQAIPPGMDDAVDVAITTGQHALQREASLGRMVQTGQIVQQMDPTMRADGVAIMQAAGDAQMFDASSFFYHTEPTQEQGQPVPTEEPGSDAGGPQPGSPELAAGQPL